MSDTDPQVEPTTMLRLVDQLHELGPVIDESLKRTDNTPEHVDGLERLSAVLTFIGKRLDGADNRLLVEDVLTELSGHVASAITHVKHFAELGKDDQLAAAGRAMDASLRSFASLVLPTNVEDLQGLRAAAKGYRLSLLQQARGYEKQVGVVQQNVQSVAAEAKNVASSISTEKARLTEAIAEIERTLSASHNSLLEKFSTAEETLDSAAKEAIATFKSDLGAFLTEERTAHKSAITEHTQEREDLQERSEAQFLEKTKEWHEAVSTTAEESAAKIAKLESEFEERAKRMVVDIQTNLDRANKLLKLIGERGVTAGHKLAADEARWRVLFWQTVAVVSMITFVAFAAASALGLLPRIAEHFQPPETTTPSPWLLFANRLYFSLAIAILAGYAANQASRYQHIERRNRKLELEVNSLGPFLQDVSPEERERFQLKMAEAFFGRNDDDPAKPGPTNALQIFEQVTKSKEAPEVLGDFLKAVIQRLKL